MPQNPTDSPVTLRRLPGHPGTWAAWGQANSGNRNRIARASALRAFTRRAEGCGHN